MSKRISPTAIGIFVVGSFALAIAAVVVVGAGNLFKRPERFVCLFPGNVNGLRLGAPVKFRRRSNGYGRTNQTCLVAGRRGASPRR